MSNESKLILKDELKTLISDIETKFPVKISYSKEAYHFFGGGGGEDFVILGFIIGAVAGGFFSEIGKDLWSNLKSVSKKIYNSLVKDKANLIIDVKITIDDGREIWFSFIANSDTEFFSKHYGGDPINFFGIVLLKNFPRYII